MTSSSSIDAPPPRPAGPAIVAGHADFAAGLVSAVGAITGRGDLLIPITNRDAAVDEIERRLADAADAHGVRVIFIDLPAGSCAFAARRLLRTRPEMLVVTGVNLPALLDYVFHAELPAEEAVEHAAHAARSAPGVVRGAPAESAAPSSAAPSSTGAAGGGQRAG